MIKLNEYLTASSSSEGWLLEEEYDGFNKKKEPIVCTRKYYYPTLESTLRGAADKVAGRCDSIEVLLAAWRELFDNGGSR